MKLCIVFKLILFLAIFLGAYRTLAGRESEAGTRQVIEQFPTDQYCQNICNQKTAKWKRNGCCFKADFKSSLQDEISCFPCMI